MTQTHTIVLHRTYDAGPVDLWALWTTREGIESWWGPDGFVVEVHDIDVTPGGRMLYSMRAVGPEQVTYMREAGLPVDARHSLTFSEVTPYTRLAYMSDIDFIPGVAPYESGMTVEFTPHSGGTRLTMTLDAMHDEYWTGLAVAGWENELDRLAHAVQSRKDSA